MTLATDCKPTHATTAARPRDRFGMAAQSVMEDPTLSMAARVAWAILDGRQGSKARQRLKLDTIATAMGTSKGTARRALDELKARALVTSTRTGRSNWWAVENPARVARANAENAHPRPVRVLTGEHSECSLVSTPLSKNSLRDKQASKTAAGKVTAPAPRQAPAAAADPPEQAQAPARVAPTAPTLPTSPPLADTLAVETYVGLLPKHLQPTPTTDVARNIGLALSNGWTINALAAATAAQITNPNARPGLACRVLADLAQQPAREQTTPTTSTARDPWCGECDERTRLAELADGSAARCPTCHPLRGNRDLQQAAADRAKAQGLPLADPLPNVAALLSHVITRQEEVVSAS